MRKTHAPATVRQPLPPETRTAESWDANWQIRWKQCRRNQHWNPFLWKNWTAVE